MDGFHTQDGSGIRRPPSVIVIHHSGLLLAREIPILILFVFVFNPFEICLWGSSRVDHIPSLRIYIRIRDLTRGCDIVGSILGYLSGW